VQIERRAADGLARPPVSDTAPATGSAVLRLIGNGMVPGDR
jgi:hypothetical protein